MSSTWGVAAVYVVFLVGAFAVDRALWSACRCPACDIRISRLDFRPPIRACRRCHARFLD